MEEDHHIWEMDGSTGARCWWGCSFLGLVINYLVLEDSHLGGDTTKPKLMILGVNYTHSSTDKSNG